MDNRTIYTNKYRRCKVSPGNPKIDPFFHYAWIPEDKASLGKPLKLQFPGQEEQVYVIEFMDTLIIDAYLLPFLQEHDKDCLYKESL